MKMGEIYTIPFGFQDKKSICIINDTYDPFREIPYRSDEIENTIVLEQGKHYDFDFSMKTHEGYVTDITRYHNLELEDIIPSIRQATLQDLREYADQYQHLAKCGKDNVTRLIFSYPRIDPDTYNYLPRLLDVQEYNLPTPIYPRIIGKQTIIVNLENIQLPEGISPIKPTEGDVKHD